MRALGASRTSVVPGGVLAGPWVRNELWRRARAVPSLDLRFADDKSLTDAVTGQSLITFTRASSGTFVDSAGVIQTAATDVPRFDHNPTTGESLGLLVEEARTNFATQSESFSGWTVGNLVQSTATVTSPSGGSTAQLFVEDTATSSHRLFLSPTTGQLTNSFSVWVKPASGARLFYIESDGPTGTRRTLRFNLQAGTVDFTAGDWTNPFITAYANGWFKVGGTITDNGGSVLFIVGSSNGAASSYTGDSTSGFYLWGAQLEAGAFPTSYIPTTTATVTRAADVASITGSAFSSWYRQDAQTWFGEYAPLYNASATVPANTVHLLQVYNTAVSTNNYAIRGATNSVSQELVARNPTAGLQFVNNGGIGFGVAGTNRKVSFGIDSSTLNASTNGTINSAANTVAALMATHDILSIGSGTGGTPPYQLNGTIRRLAYWPTRLANSTLQEVTR